MPYAAVSAVSSLPVAGAKMALCVHTWLTKQRRTTNYIIFMPVSVIFHGVHTEYAIFAPTTGRLETPITALYCISGEK